MVLLITCAHEFQYYMKQLAIPVGFQSKDEMLGCTIHAVNKHIINTL